MEDEKTKAKNILSTKYNELLNDTNYLTILNSIHICADNSEYLQKRLDTNFLPPNAKCDEIIHNVLKNTISNIPNEKVIDFTKKMVNDSFISELIPKELIDKAFNDIYICKDEDEFRKIYGEDTDGIDGFNRAGISYLKNSSTPHAIIHELLHTFSSEFDKDGHRIKNGLMGDEVSFTSTMINEGATDYLAQKISHEQSGHYSVPREFFSKISPILCKYYKDENALFKLYTSNNDSEFRIFLDTINKKTSSKELYTSFILADKEKLNDYIKNCEKGLNKIEKRRQFEEKHPKLYEMTQRIKMFFSKNKEEQRYLPEKIQDISTDSNSFISDLKNNVESLEDMKDKSETVKEFEKNKEKQIDSYSQML